MDYAHIRALVSFAVLGAGLIVVASSLQRPSADLKHSLGPVTTIAKERSQEAQPVAKEPFGSFAPQGSWFDATLSADTMREQPGIWAPLLATEQTTIRIGADTAARLSPAEQPNQADRRELARALQLELKRVHCYDGSIDGEWLLQSKRAMKAFLDRVNASLPIDNPDQILLTLVKGHVNAACGQVCPEGQNLAANGRCLPKPTVAADSVDSNSVPGSADQPTVARNDNGIGEASAPTIPLSGAMMAGGPRSEPAKQSNAPPARAETTENLFIHPLGGY
jgi:hypothetical protein